MRKGKLQGACDRFPDRPGAITSYLLQTPLPRQRKLSRSDGGGNNATLPLPPPLRREGEESSESLGAEIRTGACFYRQPPSGDPAPPTRGGCREATEGIHKNAPFEEERARRDGGGMRCRMHRHHDVPETALHRRRGSDVPCHFFVSGDHPACRPSRRSSASRRLRLTFRRTPFFRRTA